MEHLAFMWLMVAQMYKLASTIWQQKIQFKFCLDHLSGKISACAEKEKNQRNAFVNGIGVKKKVSSFESNALVPMLGTIRSDGALNCAVFLHKWIRDWAVNLSVFRSRHQQIFRQMCSDGGGAAANRHPNVNCPHTSSTAQRLFFSLSPRTFASNSLHFWTAVVQFLKRMASKLDIALDDAISVSDRSKRLNRKTNSRTKGQRVGGNRPKKFRSDALPTVTIRTGGGRRSGGGGGGQRQRRDFSRERSAPHPKVPHSLSLSYGITFNISFLSFSGKQVLLSFFLQ